MIWPAGVIAGGFRAGRTDEYASGVPDAGQQRCIRNTQMLGREPIAELDCFAVFDDDDRTVRVDGLTGNVAG